MRLTTSPAATLRLRKAGPSGDRHCPAACSKIGHGRCETPASLGSPSPAAAPSQPDRAPRRWTWSPRAGDPINWSTARRLRACERRPGSATTSIPLTLVAEQKWRSAKTAEGCGTLRRCPGMAGGPVAGPFTRQYRPVGGGLCRGRLGDELELRQPLSHPAGGGDAGRGDGGHHQSRSCVRGFPSCRSCCAAGLNRCFANPLDVKRYVA